MCLQTVNKTLHENNRNLFILETCWIASSEITFLYILTFDKKIQRFDASGEPSASRRILWFKEIFTNLTMKEICFKKIARACLLATQMR